VIGVAENDRGADAFEVPVQRRLHAALRADRHERRRFDLAVRSGHDTASRPSVGFGNAEAENR